MLQIGGDEYMKPTRNSIKDMRQWGKDPSEWSFTRSEEKVRRIRGRILFFLTRRSTTLMKQRFNHIENKLTGFKQIHHECGTQKLL
jgi:hypothetical protein